ncbi:hypothetical protein O181_051543 [Austropuccinia psidii MF-1]|uniref:Retroviral polymerase SH3-like domain-containing protein n=1 Tax=Austropuccinia psidii MF-1 TaxID=1389203 RepID=A0A9Q3E3V0_9BASI|nr:hypothetical protein [Austropuccinia psidii MF-1]
MHLVNIIPTPLRNNKSLFFLWTGVAPKIQMMRMFGCKAFFHIPRHQHNWKLAPTGEIGILVGFTNESAYHILKISEKRFYTKPNNILPKTSWKNLFEEDKFYHFLEEVAEQAPISEDQSEDESVSSNLGKEEPESPPKNDIKLIGPRHPTSINSDISETNILPYCRHKATHATHSDPCTFTKALKSEESD